ncbi:MAG: nucleotidyltransferase family protein [Oligoflexia bacterium]|nr:nucleotidyltransferase family protein [Oligoflexia bacterium]
MKLSAEKKIKAMILAAGKGERLGSLTAETPKPMLSVAEKPLLEWTINHLKNLGISDIVINLNINLYGRKIYDYFEDGKKFDVNIKYSYEDRLLGTAGAVKKAQPLLEDADGFLVLYGDVFSNYDYRELIEKHFLYNKEDNLVATILLHQRQKSNSIVEINNQGKIVEFIERPDEKSDEKSYNNIHLVNSGLYFFDKKIFSYMLKDQFYDFPKDIFNILVREEKIFAVLHQGYRMAVDSAERYFKLCEDVVNEKPFSNIY